MKITTIEQFQTLVAELEKNPPLAKGFQRGASPANLKQQWAVICAKLNAIGPPIRDNDGWQKVWRDLKFKVKKRIATNKAECNATGGGRYKQQPLTPLEEAVANLMQFYKQVDPEGVVQGVDFQADNELQEEIDALTEEVQELCPTDLPVNEERPTTSANSNLRPQTSAIRSRMAKRGELIELCPTDLPANEERPTTSANANMRPQTPAIRSRKTKKGDLLQNHTNMQEKMLSEICEKLVSLKRNISDSVRYKKRQLEVEQKKLEIMEKRERREEEMHEIDMKIKKLKLKRLENKVKSDNKENKRQN